MKRLLIVISILSVAIIAISSTVFSGKEAGSKLSPLLVRSCAEKIPAHKHIKPSVVFSAPSAAPPMAGAPSMKSAQPQMEMALRPSPAPAKGGIDVHKAGKKVEKDVAKASQIYLSNDDSMSLASAQRIFYVIDNFQTLYRSQVRPHELLNYYHFKTLPVADDRTFSVLPDLSPADGGTTMSFSVQGKTLTKADRQKAVVTLIVDRSGSMSDRGKMEYLKKGLAALTNELKAGDVVNMTWFDHEVCTPMESYVVGRDGRGAYDKALKDLGPRGSTNLHDGLVEGYKLAEKYYDPSKMNRVILITDALANTGELSPELMASIGKYYDTKKIALSGVGVGQDFNDDLLDEITEKGRGAYLFLGSGEAVKRVFGADFISLLETVSRDVHFRVTLPKSLKMDVFYGEEVSTDKSKVQPISYFANTAQLFLMDLKGKPAETDSVAFDITYKGLNSDEEKTQTETWAAGEAMKDAGNNIKKARVIMAFADMLEKTATQGDAPCARFCFSPFVKSTDAKELAANKKICAEGQDKMKKLAADISGDEEVKEVLDRAAKYCSRF